RKRRAERWVIPPLSPHPQQAHHEGIISCRSIHPETIGRWIPCSRVSHRRYVGEVVLDPFAGTGTTGRVALAFGRRAWLIEREPAYWPRLEAAHSPPRTAPASSESRTALETK